MFYLSHLNYCFTWNKNELIKFYNIHTENHNTDIYVFTKYGYFHSKSESWENYDLKLKKKIILYPATFWAHKNHNFIIEATRVMVKTIKMIFVLWWPALTKFQSYTKLINSENLQNYITIFHSIKFFVKKLYEE